MRPVENGISDSVRHNLGVLHKLLKVSLVAGDIALVNTHLAHQAPLIVIAAEPALGDVRELSVVINFLYRKMTMEIENRHILRVVFVQRYGCLIFQDKVLIHKILHSSNSP